MHAGPQRRSGLFVRLPDEQMRLLDRAAATVSAAKKDLISGLVARHVDPDSPGGVERLRELAASTSGRRRVIIEGDEPRFQPGFGTFTPSAPPDVLDAAGAAELLAVDVDAILALADAGEIPGREIGGTWRFARQALLDWLSHTGRG